jgi:hypothetical protein
MFRGVLAAAAAFVACAPAAAATVTLDFSEGSYTKIYEDENFRTYLSHGFEISVTGFIQDGVLFVPGPGGLDSPNGSGTTLVSFDLKGPGDVRMSLESPNHLSLIETVLSAGTDFQTYTARANGGYFIFNSETDFTLDNLVINTADVPEPTTWAMMFAGFGLVGAAARRRQPALA